MLQPAWKRSRETNKISSCCGVLNAPSTEVHLISLHQQIEWIGFAQGSCFLMIKVCLKLFAGVCLQLILPASMGSVKSKHHKNTAHQHCYSERINSWAIFSFHKNGVWFLWETVVFSKSIQRTLTRGCDGWITTWTELPFQFFSVHVTITWDIFPIITHWLQTGSARIKVHVLSFVKRPNIKHYCCYFQLMWTNCPGAGRFKKVVLVIWQK